MYGISQETSTIIAFSSTDSTTFILSIRVHERMQMMKSMEQ